MAPVKFLSCITQEQRNMFRVLVALDQEGRSLMKEVFRYGAPTKDPKETLKQFLKNKKFMSGNMFKDKFNKTIRNTIENDPSGAKFDITIWFLAIQYGCDSLASPDSDVWSTPRTFENQLKLIKEFRNNLTHSEIAVSDVEFHKTLNRLEDLLSDALTLAQRKYSIDQGIVDKLLDKMQFGISKLRGTILEDLDLASYDGSCLFNELKDILKRNGTADLERFFRRFSIINPAALITGQDFPIEVEQIYTTLLIVGGGRDNIHKAVEVDNMLTLAHMEKKEVVLIEGIAGVGKTTLVKKICSEWMSLLRTGRSDMRELDIYDFVIPVECRSHSQDLFSNIISSLMPTLKKTFREQIHMMDCFLDFRTLVILDGVDEITKESEKVLRELLELCRNHNITVVCTTRPEKTEYIYKIVSDYAASILHFLVTGIAEKDKEKFVLKYHSKLESLGMGSQSTDGLIAFLQMTRIRLQDHWNLPLNLTFVTLLWIFDSDRVCSITSSIELLLEIHHLTITKLKERLSRRDDIPHDDLDQKITNFVSILGEKALLGLHDFSLSLPQIAIQQLSENCHSSKIPPKDLLGAFLVQKNTWSPTALISYVTFSHKNCQEYYAATYIYDVVFSQKNILTVTKVFSQIHNGLENLPSMTKYQATLVFVLGLLYYHKSVVDRETATEMIELLKKAGVTDRRHWIRVLNSVRCESTITHLISELPGLMKGTVDITNVNVFAYASLLEYTTPQIVDVWIEGTPSRTPRLDELLNNIAMRNVTLERLCMDHLFRNPGAEPYHMTVIDNVVQRCQVKYEYRGQLPSTLTLLQDEDEAPLQNLSVSLNDDNDVNILFDYLEQREEPLESLALNVGAVSQNVGFPSIPADQIDYVINIFIPDVGKGREDSAAAILRTLQPANKRYCKVYFPRCSLDTPADILALLEALQGIRMYDIVFPTQCCPKDPHKEEELHERFRRIFRCSNAISWRGDTGGSVEDMDSW